MAPVNAFTDVFASTSGRCAETAWGRSTQFTSSYQRRSFVRFPPFLATRSSPKSCYSIRVQEASSSRSSSSSSSNGKHDITSAEVPDFLLSSTRFVAETLLPTEQGKFRLRGYRHTADGGKTFTEPTAIISGSVEGAEAVPVRVHDACFTSEVLGSLKCDCKEQLQLAMEFIQENPPGMVIYLQQEGRGIGLANKIAAYALQEKGLDTVDANRALGLPDDCREYSPVKFILEDLNIKSIQLMTNNPRKISELSQLGVQVTGRIPCLVKAQKFNLGYLKAKQRRMDHLLDSNKFADGEDEVDEQELDGSFCFWDHSGEPSSAGIPLDPSIGLNSDLGDAAAPTQQGLNSKSS